MLYHFLFFKKLNSKTRNRCVWVTNNIIPFITRQNDLFPSYSNDKNNILSKDNIFEYHYKATAKIVTRRIKQCELHHYSEQINKCNGDSRKYCMLLRVLLILKKGV